MRLRAFLVSAGSGAAKVAAARSFRLSRGLRQPNAPRAFADPLASLFVVAFVVAMGLPSASAADSRSLFDGTSLAGWDVRAGEE
ncbi:MAG: hypothetical protein ACOVJ6_09785, partial [Pirellulales bacterium]